MAIRRVALVFDDRARPDTTGAYCLRALGALADVAHVRPDELGPEPPAGTDLILRVDDDLPYDLPDAWRPRAYWAIDTHRDLHARIAHARGCDLAFAAQRAGAEALRDAGVDAEWLPLACDPDVHRRHDVPVQFDACFVGHLHPGPRAELVERLRRRFPETFVGRRYFDEMAQTYSASRLVFNRSLAGDLNMRAFEALACGSLLLTDELPDGSLAALFRDGEHLATYRDADDMLAKAEHYLARPEDRDRVAASGRAEALARHTYRHRMERLLRRAEEALSMTTVAPGVGLSGAGQGGAAAPAAAVGGRPLEGAPTGLASVIVPCFNQVEFTRHCVAALARHTRGPWELVAVDDGSTDETPAYLRGVQDAADVPVTVVTLPANRGFPAACNAGLRAARGAYLVLLNNDAVVTDGWLDQLVSLAESRPEVGLAGPMSNYAAPPQLVESVPYRDLGTMHAFAARWRAEHRGRWSACEKLSGFCLLIKRRVLEAVGGLDERFGAGFFDDDDLALRARGAGFELALARDLFVHHFGSRTFEGAGIDAAALLRENREKFAAKWGPDAVAGQREVTIAPWAGGAPGTGIDTAARRVRVSLTMIVRDEEHNLPACLDSARGLFDEVVVVDTGSKDRTAELARARGARVCDFVWVDDFAAARNAALARATGDYAFWLDADDRVEPDQWPVLRALFDGLRHGDEAAYVVRCACDPEPGGGGATVVDHVRLFPLLEGVRWGYRVHEQILPSLRRAGVPVRWTDAVVRHTGYVDPALRRRKLYRDEAILREELADRPDDPFVLFNLGSIAIEREDWPTALGHLRASLAGSAPEDSIVRKLHALIARAHQGTGDTESALAACAAGLATEPDDAELLFRQAVLHRHRGEPAEAEACWRAVLGLRRPERFSSVDSGIYGHLTRRNLAALAEDRGDRAGAARLWEEVLAECPGDGEALHRLDRLHRPPEPPRPKREPTEPTWLIAGSRRVVVPRRGDGDFDPYVPVAAGWVVALGAKTVVELGVRTGVSTRALIAGAREIGGHVWGVDPEDRHGIDDPHFTYVPADAADVAGRWEAIDLLHIDTDPHTTEQTLRWFELYSAKCRAIALHDAHHPDFGVGRAVRAFVAGGGWDAHEYWGNPSGWTVLVRRGEPLPEDLP